MGTRALRFADQALYDAQIAWLRAHSPTPLAQDVVVIGIDEAAYVAIPEPAALWHSHLGLLFAGLSTAEPTVVGVATPLPVRSYDFLVKDIDASLISGIARLKSAAPLVVGQPPGIGTRLRPIAPELLAVIGEKELASLAICEDTDGVVRRINQRRCQSDDKRDPLALAMAKRLGRQGSPTGMIDYSVGGSHRVHTAGHRAGLDPSRRGRQAARAGQGPRGGGSQPAADRIPPSPAGFAGRPGSPAAAPSRRAVVHIQALRSLLARGLIERAPESLSLFLAGLGALLWFGRGGWIKGLVCWRPWAAVHCLSTFALVARQLPARWRTSCIVTLLAYVARLAWEFIRGFREKKTLRTMFAGHVSPQVMRALLGGELQLEQNGQRQAVTLLFAGIRGFAARNAQSTPEAMIGLLNRFHAAAAVAIQTSSGAVDKYVGDGLMATFGLPQPLPAPQRNALEAAQDLLLRVDRLNANSPPKASSPPDRHRHPQRRGAGRLCRLAPAPRVLGDRRRRRHRQPPRKPDQGIVATRCFARKPSPPPSALAADWSNSADGPAPDPRVWGWTPPLAVAAPGGVSVVARHRWRLPPACRFAGSRWGELGGPCCAQLQRQIHVAGVTALPVVMVA
jgi:hypothetical protein